MRDLFDRSLMATSAVIAAIAVAAPAEAQAMRFDVPAQAAVTGIATLGRQGNVQIISIRKDTRDKRTNAVSGEMGIEQALDQLLRGTGLSARKSGARTYSIYRLQKIAALSAPAGLAEPSIAAAPAGAAQSTTRADAQDAAEDDAAAEIVVTAQKRTERLIDVPQSVSVLSAETLQKMGATQFRDYADTIAGLTYRSSGAGATQISLRGVTAGNFDIGPTVAVYVDEVAFGSSTIFANGAQYALDVALSDLDRLEVLRGPQGTLYGASAMGGLLKYVSRSPDASSFSAVAQGGVSSTRHGGINFDGTFSINAPLVADKVALKANGFFSRDGGYVDNLFSGEDDVNRSRIYGGRADLLAELADGLTVRVGAFLQNIRREGTAYADYDFGGTPVTNSLEQSGPFDESFEQRFRLISATINYDLGPVALTSVSSYQTIRTTNIVDFSRLLPFTNAPADQGGLGRNYSAIGLPQFIATDKFTQEIRAQSDDSSALEWVIGGYYTHEDSERQLDFAPLDANGQPAPNDLLSGFIPSEYEEIAAFANLTWKITPKFDLSGGVRYAHNKQSFTQNGAGLFLGAFPEARSSEGVFTYLANARYRFSDHATAYVRYATAYRPGGPNYIVNDPGTGQPFAPPTFKADTLQNYEVGLHAETPGRTFGIDAALYYINWDNIQIAAVRGGLDSILNIPGGAEIKGAELTLTARPSRSFTATGAFAYQDAQLSQGDSDLGAQKGDRLAAVPRFTATVSGDYVWRESTLRPFVGATIRYVSDRPAEFGPSAYTLPDYATVDLRAGLELSKIDVQLFVRNLFDVRQQLTGERAGAIERVAMGQPRTIGLRFSSNF